MTPSAQFTTPALRILERAPLPGPISFHFTTLFSMLPPNLVESLRQNQCRCSQVKRLLLLSLHCTFQL
jgi:hypothetical protein